jgi:uncharacterized protein YjbI with pentapeptide repeats
MSKARDMHTSVEYALSSGEYVLAQELVNSHIARTGEKTYPFQSPRLNLECSGFCVENVSFENTDIIVRQGKGGETATFIGCVFSEANFSGCTLKSCSIGIKKISDKMKLWYDEQNGYLDVTNCTIDSCSINPGSGSLRAYNCRVSKAIVSGAVAGSYVRFELCDMNDVSISNSVITSLTISGKVDNLSVSECTVMVMSFSSPAINDSVFSKTRVKEGKIDLGATKNFKIVSSILNLPFSSRNMSEVRVIECSRIAVFYHKKSGKYAYVYSELPLEDVNTIPASMVTRRDRLMMICHCGYCFRYSTFMSHLEYHEDKDMAAYFAEKIRNLA